MATILTTSNATPRHKSSMTITGTSFGASQGAGNVILGNTSQSINSWSDTSISIIVDRGSDKYGAQANLVVTNAGAQSNVYTGVTGINAQADWTYVTISNLESNSSLRITSSPDLANTDQIAWNHVDGKITVISDGTIEYDVNVLEANVEIWSSGLGWGTAGIQRLMNYAQPQPSAKTVRSNVVAGRH